MSTELTANPPAPSSGGGAVGIFRQYKGNTKKDEKKDEGGEAGPDNLKPGTHVYGLYRDGTERRACILERRPIRKEALLSSSSSATTDTNSSSSTSVPVGGGSSSTTAIIRDISQYRYYVHWLDFNRRMDSWVTHTNLRFDPEGEAEAKKKRDAASKSSTVAETVLIEINSNNTNTNSSNIHGKGGKGSGGTTSTYATRSSQPQQQSHHHHHGSSSNTHGDEHTNEEVDESGTVYRGRKRRADGTVEFNFVEPEHSSDGMNEEAIREHEDVTKVKNVNEIELGKHKMETWYFSPLPKEYWLDDYIDVLYFCEFCLRFFKHKSELTNHSTKCRLRHPPGDEIYRGSDGIGMWEIDGAKEKQYCQNLSYLAKMFLDHKTLYHDVDLFMFYVMTEQDEHGYHIVGYYSKEKYSEVGYNLACILALPCHQRKGYGRFLIQFSYELSKIEKKIGHPEKPLSDLGLLSYRSYWTWVLLGILRSLPEGEEISVLDIMRRTSIRQEDITSTLHHLGLLKSVAGGTPTIHYDKTFIESEFRRQEAKPGPRVDPARVIWSPLRIPLPQGIKKDKWLISAKISDMNEDRG